MVIRVSGSEKFEAQGTTVALKHLGPGEFEAVYWDELNMAFVEVPCVNPNETVVDADNITKLRYVAQARRNAPPVVHDKRTPEEYTRLAAAFGHNYSPIRWLLKNEYRLDGPLPAFARSCIRQIDDWLEGKNHQYSCPLSHRQIRILRGIIGNRRKSGLLLEQQLRRIKIERGSSC